LRPAALGIVFSAALLAQPLVFRHVTVIDATGGPPIPNTTVITRGGLIERITTDAEPPQGATIIDAAGKFLIPGLWDMHVHVTDLERDFRTLTAYGITGIRDMYSGFAPEVYSPWRARAMTPRIVAAGMIDAPVRPPSPAAFGVATADDARLAVQLLAANRAEFIKVYSSLSREAYFAMADEARRIGMAFAGHVPESVSPREAAEAGQLSQEHLINILLSCSTREEELRAERVALLTDRTLSVMERARRFGWPQEGGLFDTYDPQKAAALFEAFVDHGVWHTPTLVVSKYHAEATPENRGFMMLDGLSPEGYAPFAAHVRAVLGRYQKLVGYMHAAGVALLAGSDAGPATGLPLGLSLHEELELLVQSGLTPMEALQTATRNPAFYFGILTLMGTVEEGKSADLILLDANPLEDIRNTRKISAVVMRGAYFSREILDQSLGR
jgi:imidazolonepropionase-like amidohydrolase